MVDVNSGGPATPKEHQRIEIEKELQHRISYALLTVLRVSRERGILRKNYLALDTPTFSVFSAFSTSMTTSALLGVDVYRNIMCSMEGIQQPRDDPELARSVDRSLEFYDEAKKICGEAIRNENELKNTTGINVIIGTINVPVSLISREEILTRKRIFGEEKPKLTEYQLKHLTAISYVQPIVSGIERVLTSGIRVNEKLGLSAARLYT